MMTDADVLQSPVLPLLVELEAAGFSFKVAGDRVLVRPVDQLTPEQRTQLREARPAVLALLRVCDAGVALRREAFTCQVASAGGAMVPVLLFTPGVPYVAGVCFSCADPNGTATYGRCWRCSLAWRLALRLPIALDLALGDDAAKRIA